MTSKINSDRWLCRPLNNAFVESPAILVRPSGSPNYPLLTPCNVLIAFRTSVSPVVWLAVRFASLPFSKHCFSWSFHLPLGLLYLSYYPVNSHSNPQKKALYLGSQMAESTKLILVLLPSAAALLPANYRNQRQRLGRGMKFPFFVRSICLGVCLPETYRFTYTNISWLSSNSCCIVLKYVRWIRPACMTVYLYSFGRKVGYRVVGRRITTSGGTTAGKSFTLAKTQGALGYGQQGKGKIRGRTRMAYSLGGQVPIFCRLR